MYLESAINRFTAWLSAERNLSPKTVEAYGYDLHRWRVRLEGDRGGALRPAELATFDLKDYLAHLQEDLNYKPATLARVVSSIRIFFDWLTQEEIIDANPSRPLRTPKKAKRLPVYLTADEAHRLLAVPDRTTPDGLRDHAALHLLLMTGIRLAEIVGLNVADVDCENALIKVLGKGRKERLVPLNSEAVELLRRYLTARPPGRCDALFLDRKGNRISRRTIQYAVRKYSRSAALSPRISPHKLRHTFATSLYAEDVDLKDIQELLGHADISSTSIYTHTNVEKVRAAVEKLGL